MTTLNKSIVNMLRILSKLSLTVIIVVVGNVLNRVENNEERIVIISILALILIFAAVLVKTLSRKNRV